MDNPHMAEVDVRFDLLSFGEHSSTNVVCFKDEHPPILCNELAFILDEVPMMSESDLHSLINDLSD